MTRLDVASIFAIVFLVAGFSVVVYGAFLLAHWLGWMLLGTAIAVVGLSVGLGVGRDVNEGK